MTQQDFQDDRPASQAFAGNELIVKQMTMLIYKFYHFIVSRFVLFLTAFFVHQDRSVTGSYFTNFPPVTARLCALLPHGTPALQELAVFICGQLRFKTAQEL
jgi:hypothetical protein